MRDQLPTSPAEPPSAAAIAAKFKTDMQAAYDNVESLVDFKLCNKGFYQYLQNLPSKVETEKSAENIPKFVGDKNDSAYVKKCFQQMAEDIRKLDVNEYLASVENSLLTLKLAIHDIERKSDGLPLETLRKIHKKKEKEWKASIKTYTEKLEKTNERFYFLQNCVIDNYELISNQMSDIFPSVELSDNARMQYDYFDKEKDFLADATKFIMTLRSPCMEMSEKVHRQTTRPAEESHEHLFIGPYKQRPAAEIIKAFISRCSAVERKLCNSQFKRGKCIQYLDTAYRFIDAVRDKTDHFIQMSKYLDKVYCSVAKNANEHIFINLVLDKKRKCIEEMKVAEQLLAHTNEALDTLVDTDNVFQPSTSSSSTD